MGVGCLRWGAVRMGMDSRGLCGSIAGAVRGWQVMLLRWRASYHITSTTRLDDHVSSSSRISCNPSAVPWTARAMERLFCPAPCAGVDMPIAPLVLPRLHPL